MCVIVQYLYECEHKHGIAWQERCGAVKILGRPCLTEGVAPTVNRVRDGSGACRACKDKMEMERMEVEKKQIEKEVEKDSKEERREKRKGRYLRKDEIDLASASIMRIDLSAQMAKPNSQDLLKIVKAEVEAGRATVQFTKPEGKVQQRCRDVDEAVRPCRSRRKADLSTILEEEEPSQTAAQVSTAYRLQ